MLIYIMHANAVDEVDNWTLSVQELGVGWESR